MPRAKEIIFQPIMHLNTKNDGLGKYFFHLKHDKNKRPPAMLDYKMRRINVPPLDTSAHVLIRNIISAHSNDTKTYKAMGEEFMMLNS
jgi:hypothetical protein